MPNSSASRQPANLTLDRELLADARELQINLSRAAEAGVRDAVRAAKIAAWKAENAEAFKSRNAYVEKHGLPLEKYRQF